MSFAEVKNLRKAGSLEEAFAMAQVDLNTEPENIWNKRSMSWVYFDQLKAAALAEEFQQFEANIDRHRRARLASRRTHVLGANLLAGWKNGLCGAKG